MVLPEAVAVAPARHGGAGPGRPGDPDRRVGASQQQGQGRGERDRRRRRRRLAVLTALDVQPDKSGRSEGGAKGFVASLPTPSTTSRSCRCPGSPSVRVPPITDRSALNRAIDALTLQDSTAIGDSIKTALAALDQAPKGDDKSSAPGIVVLLSDSASTAGDRRRAMAPDAAKRGTSRSTRSRTARTTATSTWTAAPATAYRPTRSPQGHLGRDQGAGVQSADNVSQLKDAYTSIKSEVGYENKVKEITATAAGVGLIFALLAAVGALILGARWA